MFSHTQELRLSSDYLFLLRAQSSFDLVGFKKITLATTTKPPSKDQVIIFLPAALPHHLHTHHRLPLRFPRLLPENRALRAPLDISVSAGELVPQGRKGGLSRGESLPDMGNNGTSRYDTDRKDEVEFTLGCNSA